MLCFATPMSAPVKNARPSAPPRTPHRSRWIDTLSSLTVAAAIGAVLFAAAPSLLRAVSTPASMPSRAAEHEGDLSPHASGSAAHGFTFAEGDDEPDTDAPSHGWSSIPGIPADSRNSAHVSGDDDESTHAEAKVGLARRTLKLVAKPAAGAELIGEVKEGGRIMVVREQGEWLLVYAPGDGVSMGWARKSDIAVR
jgi:hypothetical protein